MINDEFNRWEELLSSLTEAQITARKVPNGWSIKDEMAHLWAWQTRTIARLNAGLFNKEPEFPRWPANLDPNAEDVDQINAWIYETNRERSWRNVHQDWKKGFQRFVKLTEALPEKDLLDKDRYAWLGGKPLSFIIESSYNHHEEHLEPLLAWRSQQGDKKKTV